jgi:uncharacterized protein (DUF302 family)
MSAKSLAYTVQSVKPSVPETVEALTEALKQVGFGVLGNINVAKIIKEKTGKTIDDYVILEVCNAKDASVALSAHKEVGLMLPCKVVIYKEGAGASVSLYKPTEAIKSLGITDLNALAEEVEEQLIRAVDSIALKR